MPVPVESAQTREHSRDAYPVSWLNPANSSSGAHARETIPARLHHFFERACGAYPDNVALVCGTDQLTYADLDARANRLAGYLACQGIGPGDRVGLLLERSVNSYVALLAVLKCGAAFVPLDTAFPADRVAFIVEDAGLALLVTTSDFQAAIKAVRCTILTLDAARDAAAAESAARPTVPDGGDALCYIIYTSGTTGRPKGVAVNHSSICNFVSVSSPIYGVTDRDRVYQGMTLAFDFSIEEVWPTFRAGATLIAGPTDHRRFGAGLTEFLIEERITVLACVPTLLATVERDVPTLRTLLVGGEACPADLVKRWSRPGRRMLNTYGPTETTVTATWSELVSGKPVTIGRPLPTYTAYILDEDLRPVARGEAGEICIGGPGVAVGYINRPELTAETFVPDPFTPLSSASGERDRGEGVPRLYRTGDLGVLTPGGDIEYLGRIDTQVKIRGYRIELAEIEAVLLEDAAVANAVVALVSGDGGLEELAAYIVPRGDVGRDSGPAKSAAGSESYAASDAGFDSLRRRLHSTLRLRLPAYMVPAHVERIDAVPMLPSHKADRSRLPRPSGPRLAAGAGGDQIPPETPLEREIAGAFARVFGHEILSVEADFFLDLGGHSLFAAKVVSDLRHDPELRHLAIADLYAHPTVRELARHVEKHAAHGLQTVNAGAVRHADRRVWAGGLLQMTFLYFVLIPWLAPTAAVVLLLTSADLSPGQMVAGVALAVAAAPLIALLLPVALKWLLLGRVRPGRYPLWGWFFCRWWLVRRLLQTAPIDLLAGSPLLAPYLWLLGARVGRGCYLGSGRIDVPDLIAIGNGASIGYDVDLDPSHIADGWLYVAPLHVGAGAYVGTNAVISGGSSVGRGARVVEQSLVVIGQTIPDGETWAGSPAQRAEADPQFDELTAREPATPRWSPLLIAGFILGFLVLELLPSLLLVPGLFVVWGLSGGDLWLGVALTPAAGLLHVLATCALVALGKRMALPTLQPGVYPLRSSFGLRKWLADRLMILHMGLTNSLYSTLYLLPFLRLLGARVGPRAEVSTVSHIDPDLLTLGQECFVADLAVIGAARFYNGFVVMGETQVGARGFVGNAALVPGDTRLGHDSLIGVLSVSPPRPVEPGSSWLGSPAIFLPRRQTSAKFDESRTYRPPARLVACRLAIEFFRVALPSTLNFVAMFLIALAIMSLDQNLPLSLLFLLLPTIYFGAGALVTGVVAALKWLIVARYRPRVEPQWSHFVWRTELVTGLYENVAVPWVFHWLAGTPLMAPALRVFGARIGRRVFMESHFVTEFDLVHVGDDAAVGGHASLQTHLFEDRVMKMSTVTVGPACSVGSRAVVLYDAELGRGSELDSLSLVMKGESLPEGSRWRGIPARLIE
jgi:non-ribosomal peptide synthetase-like protein